MSFVVIIIAKRGGLFIVEWKANPLLLIEDCLFHLTISVVLSVFHTVQKKMTTTIMCPGLYGADSTALSYMCMLYNFDSGSHIVLKVVQNYFHFYESLT